MNNNEDLSRKTVAVLLTVAIIVAFLGTWLIFSTGPISLRPGEKTTTGEVKITILESPEVSIPETGGDVKITITK